MCCALSNTAAAGLVSLSEMVLTERSRRLRSSSRVIDYLLVSGEFIVFGTGIDLLRCS